jgi:hypothetical protein
MHAYVQSLKDSITHLVVDLIDSKNDGHEERRHKENRRDEERLAKSLKAVKLELSASNLCNLLHKRVLPRVGLDQLHGAQDLLGELHGAY